MFLLAHMGVTLAAVKFSTAILDKLKAAGTTAEQKQIAGVPDVPEHSRFSVSSGVDYRFLLLGSILPDIIDKPLGLIILRQQLANGRIFLHTLLFALILLHAGVLLSGRGRRVFLSLFIGVAFHLALDGMWRDPHTLLWPLYGWTFVRGTPMSLSQMIRVFLRALATNPALMGSEAIGGMLLAVALLSLMMRGRYRRFIRQGDL